MEPPFVSVAVGVPRRVTYTLASLTALAALFAAVHDPGYLLKFIGVVLAGLAIDCAYRLLSTGRPGIGNGSSAVTAALLVLSVPATMPVVPVLYGLGVALVLVRLSESEKAIHLNAMLVGRLFLMLAYNEEIVAWSRRGLDLDAVSTATPLELYHGEEVVHDLLKLLSGRIDGAWGGMYELVPGSPGEVFGPVILALGALLVWRRAGHWRVGAAFLAAFALASLAIGEAVVFSVLSGSVLFAAVFIAGDPKSTPVSRGGRYAAGVVAGVANALIRRYTYYAEGIVFAFLLANVLSPTLDRIAFACRSRILVRRRKAFETRSAS